MEDTKVATVLLDQLKSVTTCISAYTTLSAVGSVHCKTQ